MALHGRHAELSAASRAIESARAGVSRPVVVVGEAGIGKTALLAAAADEARAAGLVVLRGGGVAQERDLPFALAAALLDDHADDARPQTVEALGAELAAVLPSSGPRGARAPESIGAAERFRYHRALRALVDDIAAGDPFALVLDDLQWADDASLEWVLHLLRRPPRAPGAMLLATRPGEHAFRLVDAARDDGEHVALGPLPDAAGLAMLDGVVEPAAAARLVREAAGNPLFLRELARVAPDGGSAPPATIVASVQREAAGLPPEASDLLAGAAVAGEPFDPALAATAAAMPVGAASGALDVLVAADLVRPDAGGRTFRFRHPLVARAIYEALPPAARRAAHQRVAAELGRRDAAPALRAHHVERSATAGDDEAIRLLALAAAQAVDTAPATAAHWWGTALELLGHDAAQQRGELLLARAGALAASGRPEEALTAFDELERHGPAQSVRAAGPAARIERLLGRNAAARARLLRALEHAPDADRGELELELAAVRFASGEVEATVEHARRAASARPAADAGMLAIVRAVEAFAALWSGSAGADALEEAEQLALSVSERDSLEPAQWVGNAAFQCERYAQAARLLTRATAPRPGRRADHMLPPLRTLLALALFFDLRPAEALEQVEAAEEGARLQNVPFQVAFALSTRAIVLELLGRTGEAESSAADSLSVLARAEPSLVTRIAGALDRAVLRAHDPERLLGELAALLGPELEGVERATSMLRFLIPAAIAVGRRDDAERWVARGEAFTDRHGLPAGRVRLGVARAELLLAAGDAGPARDRSAAAVELADAAGLRQDGVRARLVLGRAAAAAGDRAGALAALERAFAEAARAGAGGLAAEAGRELRAAGGRLSAGTLRAGGAGGGLSERERSIAELVARGRSNKEVAAALFVSTKTVENNLSRIYAKLGVRRRAELARVLSSAVPDSGGQL